METKYSKVKIRPAFFRNVRDIAWVISAAGDWSMIELNELNHGEHKGPSEKPVSPLISGDQSINACINRKKEYTSPNCSTTKSEHQTVSDFRHVEGDTGGYRDHPVVSIA
ncbi:hypothetical protein ACT691_12015 [Vibrio metschnikovii]